jgi:hypothetical protein
MFVLMIRLICATDTANIAGTIFESTRFTPRCASARTGFRPMRGSMSIFFSPGNCTRNCSTPPAITAQASA